jgi:hypothetical protein
MSATAGFPATGVFGLFLCWGFLSHFVSLLEQLLVRNLLRNPNFYAFNLSP